MAEKEVQDFWEKNKIYNFDPSRKKHIFTIDNPPPTISGKLHIGHIFSFAQTEIFARFKRMQGYNVYFPIGFDDNGLPSERFVEKELNIKASAISRDEFFEKCSTATKHYEEKFESLLKSMGFSYDFNLKYSTISDDVRKISQTSFIELAEESKAYLKESPVLWCAECQTSVAQAELNPKEKDSYFYYIPFKVENDILEIATTRPELLCGVVCIFVNPKDKRYLKYVNKKAIVPLYNFEVPILSDSEVCIDKGTGAVMCATFGDAKDVEWFNKYSLPYKNVILKHGRINENVNFIGSLNIKSAKNKIVKLLEENKSLIKSEKITHIVSTHERCDREIEIIPSKQWYVDILNRKEKLLSIANQINWYPFSMKNRYIAWVNNIKWDWCISRQRYFGVPFPVWYCLNCGKPCFAKKQWLPVDPIKFNYKDKCNKCGCSEFTPEKDVMDTWATSSLTPQINLSNLNKLINNNCNIFENKNVENFLPMSMRSQAHDIIRTWTFYTILKSLYHFDKIPWQNIMICGFVLAKKGEKISKSKGELKFDPKTLIKTHTADALRYWAANTKLGVDTFFDPNDMKDTKRFMTKLWNCSKFVISHLEDFKIKEKKATKFIDKFIINATNKIISEACNLIENFEIGLARHKIDDFFWKDFCDNYIEIVKERLYQPKIHGEEERKSAQYASYYCLINILKLYAIYVPHLTEYIYIKADFKKFEKSPSLHMLLWEENLKNKVSYDEEIIFFGEEVKNLISSVRKLKSQKNMSIKESIDSVTINCYKKHKSFFIDTEKDLIACLKAKKILYTFKS